jgi:hypothetical protein
MRKFIVVAALLSSAALFTGTPAKAEVGCECVKFGAPSVCVPGVGECARHGGICLAPCSLAPRKMMHRHRAKAKVEMKENMQEKPAEKPMEKKEK